MFVLVFVASGFFPYAALADEHYGNIGDNEVKILSALGDNSDKTIDVIAKETGLSVSAVRKGIENLQRARYDVRVVVNGKERIANFWRIYPDKLEKAIKVLEALNDGATKTFEELVEETGLRPEDVEVGLDGLENSAYRDNVYNKKTGDDIYKGLKGTFRLKGMGSISPDNEGLAFQILRFINGAPIDSKTLTEIATETGHNIDEVKKAAGALRKAGYAIFTDYDVSQKVAGRGYDIQEVEEREKKRAEEKRRRAETERQSQRPSSWERMLKSFGDLNDSLRGVTPSGLGGLGEIPSGLVQPLGPDYFQQPFLLPPPDSSLIPKPQYGSGSSFVPEPLPISYSPGSDLMTLPEFMTNLEKVFNLFGDKLSVINNPQTDSKTRTEAISTALRAKLVIFKALQTLVDSLLGKKEGQFKGQAI